MPHVGWAKSSARRFVLRAQKTRSPVMFQAMSFCDSPRPADEKIICHSAFSFLFLPCCAGR